MSEIIRFVANKERTAYENVDNFIIYCRDRLGVFGYDLNWGSNYWPSAGVAFGNLDQKGRVLKERNVLKRPFLDFAKAYLRYMQGLNPTELKKEMYAFKCLERAMLSMHGSADVAKVNSSTMDLAADIARENYAANTAYQAGKQLEKMSKFLVNHHMLISYLEWASPISRPMGGVRTGEKARRQREKKLPSESAVNAIAEIFSSGPIEDRDIFATSVSAMLLCAPCRIDEILSLPVDCEVEESKRNGEVAYGWRFIAGKGYGAQIKWIPDVMVDLAKEAIGRVKNITEEARKVADWYEKNPGIMYRHKMCPDVDQNKKLRLAQLADALGLTGYGEKYIKARVSKLGFQKEDYSHTLSDVNDWIKTRQPKSFPVFDEKRRLKYSEALFCCFQHQFRSDLPTSLYSLWRPTANSFNDEFIRKEIRSGNRAPSIFDRYGYIDFDENELKITSHQFRHLISTIAERGGLSQSEIAKWAGRKDPKQNRAYNHRSEFEMAAEIRDILEPRAAEKEYSEVAKEISKKIPITKYEFNSGSPQAAHVTEFGYCLHDFVMTPCEKDLQCLECNEHACVKGEKRLEEVVELYEITKGLREKADSAIEAGYSGADRWYDTQLRKEKHLRNLIKILRNPNIPSGSIISVYNPNEYLPVKAALGEKAKSSRLLPESSPNDAGGDGNV